MVTQESLLVMSSLEGRGHDLQFLHAFWWNFFLYTQEFALFPWVFMLIFIFGALHLTATDPQDSWTPHLLCQKAVKYGQKENQNYSKTITSRTEFGWHFFYSKPLCFRLRCQQVVSRCFSSFEVHGFICSMAPSGTWGHALHAFPYQMRCAFMAALCSPTWAVTSSNPQTT